MAPEYKKVAHLYAGKVIFAELNTQKYHQVSLIYGIKAIPTRLIFKKNKIVRRIQGALGQAQLESLARQYLK